MPEMVEENRDLSNVIATAELEVRNRMKEILIESPKHISGDVTQQTLLLSLNFQQHYTMCSEA